MRLRNLLCASFMLALASCATVQPLAEDQLPPAEVALITGHYQVVQPESLATTKSTKPGFLASLFGGKVKNKGTINVTLQHGTGNSSTTTASQEQSGKVKVGGSSSYAQDSGTATTATKAGANGGVAALGPESEASSSTTKETGLPWWLLAGVGLLAGGWLGARFSGWLRWVPGLAVVALLLMPAESRADGCPPGYDCREARRVQRAYNRVVRYHRHKNRKDNRELRKYREAQAKRLKRDHP